MWDAIYIAWSVFLAFLPVTVGIGLAIIVTRYLTGMVLEILPTRSKPYRVGERRKR